MADPNNEYPSAIQFIHSPMFIGLCASFATHLLAMVGKTLPKDVVTTFVDNGLDCVSIGLLGYAAYKRWHSKIQPLAFTEIGAAEKANSIPLNQPPEIPK